MNKKGLIIFDMDGVIVDSVMLTYSYAKKSVPIMPWWAYQRVFDNPIFLKTLKGYNKLFRKKDSQERKERQKQYAKEKLETSPIISGMAELLEKLSQDYLLAVNTNASVATSVPILEKHGLAQYFSSFKTRDDSVYKDEKILDIVKELDANIEDTLFVTDSFRDVLDGAKVGVSSIGVLTGVHLRHHFEQSDVKHSVYAISKNSSELAHYINSFFNESR